MTPTTVQLKPVQREAVRWGVQDNAAHFTFGPDSMAEWLGESYVGVNVGGRLKLRSRSGSIGNLIADIGDWIVKIEGSGFIVVPAAIFERDYVLVNDQYRFRQTVPLASV